MDGGTAAITQSALYTKNLGTAQAISTTGIYYVAFMVATANAVPTVVGINTQTTASSAAPSGGKLLGRTSGSGLTATAPGTIASASNLNGMALVYTG